MERQWDEYFLIFRTIQSTILNEQFCQIECLPLIINNMTKKKNEIRELLHENIY